jgi:hypothetical protein
MIDAGDENAPTRNSTTVTIGAEVSCDDGVCGNIDRVVLDPVRRNLTHLVIATNHRHHLDRLVPIELVDSADEAVLLHCSPAEFEQLADAEETELIKGADGGDWGYEPSQRLSLPYFGLGRSGPELGTAGMEGLGLAGAGALPESITYDKVPMGEVEVRRGQHVITIDGPIGRVRGLVIDPADYHVTHVLLEHGHLWGEKEVAIPISAVTHRQRRRASPGHEGRRSRPSCSRNTPTSLTCGVRLESAPSVRLPRATDSPLAALGWL